MTSLLGSGLVYRVDTIVGGKLVDSSVETNIMPQQAIDHVASLIRGGGASPISSWYIGVFENNYVPNAGTVAADLPSPVGESVAYIEATRPLWQQAYDGVGFIGNVGVPAEFTFTTNKTIHGAFIVSNANKGGTGGVLLSIARFSTAKSVEAGTVLRVSAGLVLTPTSVL